MLRQRDDGHYEFYWPSEREPRQGFVISTEELLLIAKESRTVQEFKCMLIEQARGILTEEAKAHRKAMRVGA